MSPMSPGWSLRLKLAAFVALLVVTVIGVGTFIETRIFEQGAERELRETAQITVRAVLDDLTHDAPLTGAPLAAVLHDYVAAAPAVHAITVVELSGGDAKVLASTSTQVRADLIDFARRVSDRGVPWWTEAVRGRWDYGDAIAARGRQFVVVLSVSSASVDAIRDSGRRLAAIFAVTAILALSLLSIFAADRLLLRPIASITRTMQRASIGDLAVRAPVRRHDELGVIASGLNEMLGKLERASADLQQRVQEATQELRERNAELVTSSQRVLTLRSALAIAEQRAAVGKVAASVAHQIGTPLNLVSGYIQMIRTQDSVDGRARERLSAAAVQVDRVAGAVRGLLDSTRHPAGEVRRADAVTIVRNMCSAAGPMLKAASVEVSMTGEPGRAFVMVDEEQIELALLSLMSNSVDAMPEGGLIDIEVGTGDGRVRIEVRDTGPGFPEDLLPHVFEPWVTTKAVGLGTGLGLSIVRDAAVAHGGEARARNGDDRGAVITVDLPAAGDGSGPPDGPRQE